MDVKVSNDENEDERIVVENQLGGPIRIGGKELASGARYAVPPDAEGVQEAIALGSLAKIRMIDESHIRDA